MSYDTIQEILSDNEVSSEDKEYPSDNDSSLSSLEEDFLLSEIFVS